MKKSEVKKEFVKVLSQFLLRMSEKKEYITSAKTSFSLRRYYSYGCKLQLDTKDCRCIVTVMNTGEIVVTTYFKYKINGDYETRKELLFVQEDHQVDEAALKMAITEAKRFIRKQLKESQNNLL